MKSPDKEGPLAPALHLGTTQKGMPRRGGVSFDPSWVFATQERKKQRKKNTAQQMIN